MATGELAAPTSWLEKLMLVGVTRIPAAVAVPISATVWGLPIALSEIHSVAERDPADVGLNVTLTVQFPGAPMAGKQVLVWEKSPALAPDMLIKLKPTGALPVLVRITDCEDCVPTDWEAKFRLVVES